jgi:hypothetical protein
MLVLHIKNTRILNKSARHTNMGVDAVTQVKFLYKIVICESY